MRERSSLVPVDLVRYVAIAGGRVNSGRPPSLHLKSRVVALVSFGCLNLECLLPMPWSYSACVDLWKTPLKTAGAVYGLLVMVML